MGDDTTWYLEHRAEALAVVYLTRRTDIVVQKQQHGEQGYDLLVELRKDHRPTQRYFGVELKSRVDRAIETSNASYTVDATWEAITIPLCLFSFVMKTEQAFYGWLLDPVIDQAGHPKLHRHSTVELMELTPKAVDDIVMRVARWYDALVKTLAA